jgi:hypothetical protein
MVELEAFMELCIKNEAFHHSLSRCDGLGTK